METTRTVLCKLLLICGVIVLLSPALAAPNSKTEPGLVGWWSFDGDRGKTAVDRSGLANHGTIEGAESVPGKVGKGLRFTAERACVRIPCRPSLNLGGAVTLEAWVCPIDPGDSSRVILSKNDEYALRIDKGVEGGKVSFFPHVGSPAVAWEPRVSSKAGLAPGKWHHLAAVWDGEKEYLYVDGVLHNERERKGMPNPNPYPVIIGNWEYPSCHGTCFGGILDEVKIWNRALTAAEVAGHTGSR